MYFNEIFGIKYPFIQGGMANIATGQFAAAVSNAGAMGLIGSGIMNAQQLEKEIRDCKAATTNPFGVNIMLMNRNSDELVDLICREKTPFVTTGAGNPGKYIDQMKAAGVKVYPVVSSIALAIRLERAGVDGVIAEGTEAGGHVGDLTTMTIVPQVIEAVNIPVIAAGGIGSGRQLAAAMMLGARGVQLGTLMLATKECPIHENYKNAVLKAGPNDTVVTGRTAGVPVRNIKNQMTRSYLKLEYGGAPKEELEKFTLGGLRKAVGLGDTKEGSLMAGQIAGQIKNIRTIEETLKTLEQEYKAAISGFKGPKF